ncbi:uncharacterized protein LOC128920481 [Zeugodacus cucurbitae]|uniref:uncharacterized protein LOC128920481 n=1 Tax=Zeugodacus cucurbitae TaxID=28588 RepID=UPI0023D92829|nr:uncharacterized protein LOC128920481 [Zeugodacus cucurbitae]
MAVLENTYKSMDMTMGLNARSVTMDAKTHYMYSLSVHVLNVKERNWNRKYSGAHDPITRSMESSNARDIQVKVANFKQRYRRELNRKYSGAHDPITRSMESSNARDIQVKVANFKQRYRSEKMAMGPSGGSPSTWPFYGRVHQIISGFKINLFNQLAFESIDESDNISALVRDNQIYE